jgi:hypothetical protein
MIRDILIDMNYLALLDILSCGLTALGNLKQLSLEQHVALL